MKLWKFLVFKLTCLAIFFCGCHQIIFQFIVLNLFHFNILWWQMVKVERLSHKLTIMSFIGNFFDNLHHLQPVSSICQAQSSIFIYLFFFFILFTHDDIVHVWHVVSLQFSPSCWTVFFIATWQYHKILKHSRSKTEVSVKRRKLF